MHIVGDKTGIVSQEISVKDSYIFPVATSVIVQINCEVAVHIATHRLFLPLESGILVTTGQRHLICLSFYVSEKVSCKRLAYTAGKRAYHL